jgi:hypothetical protein
MTPVAGSNLNYDGPGIYKHFKPPFRLYFVLGLSTECDTGKIVVVYRPMYATSDGWPFFVHRELSIFNQMVSVPKIHGGFEEVPRFKKVT